MYIKPVILCGGIGSRLWPVSRKSLPKQFAPLLGETSLFSSALKRSAQLTYLDPIVVTSEDYKFIVKRQAQDLEVRLQILLEPEGKNTAPAIFAAARFAFEKHGDSLLLVMPSDHYIPDTRAFSEMVERGRSSAEAGAIVTFGVKPSRVETGFGYIQLDKKSAGYCFDVKNFHEKPEKALATKMVSAGNFLWNAGIFLFKASAMMDLAKALEPEMVSLVDRSVELAVEDGCYWHINKEVWKSVDAKSIDHAILERSKNIKCVDFSGEWSDLGDWAALTTQLKADDSNNIIEGTAIQLDCSSSTLWSSAEGVQLVGLGLNNVTAIVTSDAVLVANTSHLQGVREVVSLLKKHNISQAGQHAKDFRPWGWFEVLVNQPGYKVKRIQVFPGTSLSLQSHEHRSEHWVVVTGTATVTRGVEKFELKENESTYINAGEKHRLENKEQTDLMIIEVQCGSYLGEDDIIRYQDEYQRLTSR